MILNRNPAVDAYIEAAAPFAKPILEKLRTLFHRACPELVETIKWGFPHFEYKGIVGSMASFKQHVSLNFWQGSLLDDPLGILKTVGKTKMGASKLTAISDLPSDELLIDYISDAVRMNEIGINGSRSPVGESL